jgi:hypothetical protein
MRTAAAATTHSARIVSFGVSLEVIACVEGDAKEDVGSIGNRLPQGRSSIDLY